MEHGIKITLLEDTTLFVFLQATKKNTVGCASLIDGTETTTAYCVVADVGIICSV